jgi:malate dehydrogenase (oxaloacetate-decarboxylating)
MKSFAFKIDPLTGEEYYEVYLSGLQLLTDPLLNKASCFTEEERITLKLDGLLPHGVSRIEDQVERCLEAYRPKPDDLERYIYLQGLLNRNETLFYRLLTENLNEMVPIVYTPTVGQACLVMSHIMRHPRGIYIHPDNIAKIDEIFQNISLPQVQLIVVTDGERILGLGDLGADGMGIPVGKVSLYVAAGGLHPACCLPMCIDVGTNNERLLKDPLYMGHRKPRLDGTEYFDFVERFVLGVKRSFPNALLQWEDFSKQKAFKLLSRYRERILCFNDDIQGTGGTACAALLTAMRIKKSRFADQRYVIVGMGQAGAGIADNIVAVLKEEGLSEEEARLRIFAIDQQGLLVEDDPVLEEQQRRYAQPRAAVADWKLESAMHIHLMDVMRNAEATVLIGVTAKRGLFGEKTLRQVAQNTDRPVVLALSNPTAKSECTPEEVMKATGGRGLTATGSPFPPVKIDGREIGIAQCNNLFIFPGMGLGALVAKANKVTDQMFTAASKALSAFVTPDQAERGYLLPEMRDIRRVSFEVALAVAREARDAGLGRLLDDEKLARAIKKAQWDPHFYPYRAGRLPL